MTDRQGNGQDGTDPRDLSGAYALDAVTPDEAGGFERAVDSSESLRAEADALHETASLLGLAATPVTPPARMKSDLMAKIALTPQLAAAAPVSATAAAPAQAPDPAVTPALSSTPDTSSTAGFSATAAPAGGPAEVRARVRWFTRPTSILIAAVAAVALFVGGGVVGSFATRDRAPSAVDASATTLAEILAANDAQRASAPIESGGTATLVWSNTLGLSAVLVDGLPELPTDKVYEAWYIDDSGVASAGTFTPSDAGTTWHVLDGTMSAGDAVGVTVEPKGGSEQPTTDPILVMQSA